jgi:hypothetical protein
MDESMGSISFNKSQESSIPTNALTDDLLTSIIAKLNIVPFDETDLNSFKWVGLEVTIADLATIQKSKVRILSHSLEKFEAQALNFISNQSMTILRLQVCFSFSMT